MRWAARTCCGRDERVPLLLDRAAALAAEPAIDQPGLSGALLYHDCRVDEPERVVLGLVKSAWHAGAIVANHVECEGLVLRNGKVEGIAAMRPDRRRQAHHSRTMRRQRDRRLGGEHRRPASRRPEAGGADTVERHPSRRARDCHGIIH